MSAGWNGADKWTILKVLFDRTVSGRSDASLTISGISSTIGRSISSGVISIHLDELVEQRLVAKQAHGVRDRYRITSDGIRYIDELSEEEKRRGSLDSRRWTGRYPIEISEEKAGQIVEQIRQLRSVIETAPLTNEEKAQAISLVSAALSVAEAPKPAWEVVKDTLLLIAGIATCLSLAVQIAGMIH